MENKKNVRVVLASASPRRQELLKLLFESFEVAPADVEEIIPQNLNLTHAPEYLATLKCKSVASKYRGALVIGADTGVFIDGKMLGKPGGSEQAFEMLTSLSGREHDVITGCCVIYGEKCVSFSSCTKVKFKPMTNKEKETYISTGEPFDKAGAYGIQGCGALYIEGINGDYYTVMGLPVNKLYSTVSEILR